MKKSYLWVLSNLKRQFTPKPPKPHPFTNEEVRAKAYELWERRGAESSSEENWADAIQELARKQQIKRVLEPVRWLWWHTGFGMSVQRIWQWTGFSEKKGWDFLQLLVAPLLLAIIASGLQEYVKEKDAQEQKVAKEREQTIADRKAKQDRQLADDKAKQDTLIKYLDQMADSLKDGLLKANPVSEKFIIAQVRTVISLQSLDGNRQHLVIQFLQAAGLNKTSDKTDCKKLGGNHMALLYKAQMEKANLKNSDLSGAVLICVNLRGALLDTTNLRGAKLKGANLSNANLSGANLRFADLSGAFLFLANLGGADLTGADLTGADLFFANLKGANISGANLSSDDLSGADLRGANLSNAYLSNANLSNANLSGANVRGANISGTYLIGANLSNAYLSGANLSNANLSGANVSGDDLRGANLSNANLRGANLSNANLKGANLSGAELNGAYLSGANKLTIAQVKSAKNWKHAHYDPEFIKELGFSL